MDAALIPDRLLQRLEWRVLRRLDGAFQGGHPTVPGMGMDLHDIRDYAPGDDVRHVEWNVTARMGDLHVRQYNEERDVTAWLLLDRSPSMGFGPVDRPKSLVLCELAGSIARLLVRGGDRVGAVLYADGLEQTIPPRPGGAQVLAIMRAILRDPPTLRGRTALGELLDTAAGMLRRRSLVVVVSGGRGPRNPLVADETTLREVAELTGGTFHAAADAGELEQVFADLPRQVERQDRREEVTWVPATLGALLLIAAFGAAPRLGPYP